jgi:hypothetical protein
MGNSFYVVFIPDRQEATSRVFEEVKDWVRNNLMAVKHYELMTKMEADLLRKAGAELYDYTFIEMLKAQARQRETGANSTERYGRIES